MLKASFRLRLMLGVFGLAALVLFGMSQPAAAYTVSTDIAMDLGFDSYAIPNVLGALENDTIAPDTGFESLMVKGHAKWEIGAGTLGTDEIDIEILEMKLVGAIPKDPGDLSKGFTSVTIYAGKRYGSGGSKDLLLAGSPEDVQVEGIPIGDFLEGFDLTSKGKIASDASGSSVDVKAYVDIPAGFFILSALTDMSFAHGLAAGPSASTAPADTTREPVTLDGGFVSSIWPLFYSWGFSNIGGPVSDQVVMVDTPVTGGVADGKVGITNATMTVIPEPSSLLLLGSGLLAVGFAVRRRKKSQKA